MAMEYFLMTCCPIELFHSIPFHSITVLVLLPDTFLASVPFLRDLESVVCPCLIERLFVIPTHIPNDSPSLLLFDEVYLGVAELCCVYSFLFFLFPLLHGTLVLLSRFFSDSRGYSIL